MIVNMVATAVALQCGQKRPDFSFRYYKTAFKQTRNYLESSFNGIGNIISSQTFYKYMFIVYSDSF